MRLDRLLESASSQAPVAGLTHGFYRYPARFSPQFARSAIEAFTEPLDTVLDPFMGGGTAAVEALGLGRRFVGSDINALGVFVTHTKTTPLSAPDEEALMGWALDLAANGSIRDWKIAADNWSAYQANTPWWIRRAIDMALATASVLDNRRQVNFARSVVLKTAQQMLESAREFRERVQVAFGKSLLRLGRFRRLIHCDAAAIARQKVVPATWLPPKLILTSPPYFGVHILYHRWQVHGRKETPAPFWIAASKDGMGASFYTFGDRQRRTMGNYLSRLTACFTSVSALMDERSTLVQLVAFSDPATQLEPYLIAMNRVGLKEAGLARQDGRFWRSVPNRKWYAKLRGGTPPSRELLLIHKRA
jgi:DNA methylase